MRAGLCLFFSLVLIPFALASFFFLLCTLSGDVKNWRPHWLCVLAEGSSVAGVPRALEACGAEPRGGSSASLATSPWPSRRAPPQNA